MKKRLREKFVPLKIDGAYSDCVISRRGRVFTEDFKKEKTGWLSADGYRKVGVTVNGKYKDILIHRALYETFIGEIPEGMVINHIDGNKLNNSLGNLEICTSGDNTRHAWKIGLCTASNDRVGSLNPAATHTNRDAIMAYTLIKYTKMKLTEIAKVLGFDKQFVSNIANGQWGKITGYNEDVKKYGKEILKRHRVFTKEDSIVLWYLHSTGYSTKDIKTIMHLTKNSVNNKITYINRHYREEMDELIKTPEAKALTNQFLLKWAVTGNGYPNIAYT